jgi:drug/metabolite transporter (DMT)-like permease
MAQTRKRRRTKHRGNAAGIVETRGRTGRKPAAGEKKLSVKEEARQRREERYLKPPTWQAAAQRAAISGAAFVVLIAALFHRGLGQAFLLGAFVTLFYVPLGYYTDKFIYNRRMAKRARGE